MGGHAAFSPGYHLPHKLFAWTQFLKPRLTLQGIPLGPQKAKNKREYLQAERHTPTLSGNSTGMTK